MSASIQHPNSKVLVLDLDMYTDGDQELRSELITLMIENIRELQQSILKNDFDLFRKVSHKVKPTIIMLNDKDLTDIIEEIGHHNKIEKIGVFNNLCNEIIKILKQN